MARLAPIHPKDLDDDQLEYYRSIRTRPTFAGVADDTPLVGPFLAWQRSVEYGQRMNSNSRYLRYDGLLDGRHVELTTIIVCRIWNADFAFNSHARGAIREGVSEEVVDAIRNGKRPNFDKKDEEIIYDFVTQLTANKSVDDAAYKAAVDLLGENAVVELVGLCGHYVTACMTLNAFEIEGREGDEPLPKID
jgi:4-carboxymuconolactone decarboxylase